MKIFNNENGVEKVYVQMDDLIKLTGQTDEAIPSIILEKVFHEIVNYDNKGMVTIDDSYNSKFIEFEEKDIISFFKRLKWIVDYKAVRNLSKGKILLEISKIEENIKNVTEKYNNMSFAEKDNSQYLLTACELLNHKIIGYKEILLNKKGEYEINFPLVPDSDGFFYNSSESNFEMRASIDSNKILIYRKDGLPLSKKDNPPKDFVKYGLEAAIKDRSEKNEFFNNYKISKHYSSDKKHFVTELITLKEKDNQNKNLIDTIKKIFSPKAKK